jgi:hypothetical protein
LGIMAAGFILVVMLSAWWIKSNLYASQFSPTKLNEREQQVLNAKLDRLQRSIQSNRKSPPAGSARTKSEGRLAPEPYTEDAARREFRITEKELNALIAKDEETARRVAIALSADLVSVKLVIPVDDEFPVLGGKTLRLNCGITLRHEAGKPVVALRGVSLGGIPLPNAWLGNIKNMDLVREFGGQGGFWDLFSKGVEDIKVLNGSLFVKLKE